MTENLGLVRRIARRHAAHGEQVDDLVQEGLVGLLKAIQRFEPRARGAVPRVRQRGRRRGDPPRPPRPVVLPAAAGAGAGAPVAARSLADEATGGDGPRARARRPRRPGRRGRRGGRGGDDGGRRPAPRPTCRRPTPSSAGRRRGPSSTPAWPGSTTASARSSTSGSSPISRRTRSRSGWASRRCTSRGSCGAPSRRWGGRIWTSPGPIRRRPAARTARRPAAGRRRSGCSAPRPRGARPCGVCHEASAAIVLSAAPSDGRPLPPPGQAACSSSRAARAARHPPTRRGSRALPGSS